MILISYTTSIESVETLVLYISSFDLSKVWNSPLHLQVWFGWNICCRSNIPPVSTLIESHQVLNGRFAFCQRWWISFCVCRIGKKYAMKKQLLFSRADNYMPKMLPRELHLQRFLIKPYQNIQVHDLLRFKTVCQNNGFRPIQLTVFQRPKKFKFLQNNAVRPYLGS